MGKRKLPTGTPENPPSPPSRSAARKAAVVRESPANSQAARPHQHPPDGRGQVLEAVVHQSLRIRKNFSGPYPPPEDFYQYNQTLPGAADRMLTMAEKEQDRRYRNDTLIILGTIMLSGGLLVLAGIAIFQGRPGIAIPFGLAGTVTALMRQLLKWWGARGRHGQ